MGSVFVIPCTFGQAYSANLVGSVTDPSGRSVPSAVITIVQKRTNLRWTTTARSDGSFQAHGLPPGNYDVRVSAPKFRELVREGVVLEVAQTVRLDLPLTLGELSGAVTVSASAGIIDSDSGSRAQTITEREIQAIPLNGRNYLALALLAPGVLPSAAGQNPHNINGARADHVGYLLDGVSNMRRRGHEQAVAPSLEAVQEFRILTNAYEAESGATPGLISVALRTGANDLHGSLFEYLRNDKLDARGFFDAEVPKLKRNQFGAMLSGPLRRNRSFLLLSYEGLRSRAAETRLSRVPSSAEREGRFTVPVRDPATGMVFAGNTIPSDRVDPVARRLLEFVPLPNRLGTFNYATSATIPADIDVVTARADHRLREGSQISLRGVVDWRFSENPFRGTNLPGFGSASEARNQSWGIVWTSSVGSSILNEARAGFNRSVFDEVSVNAGRNTAAEVGIAGVAQGSGLTNITIAGYTPFGDIPALPGQWTDNIYSASNTLSWMRGRHTFKFGGVFTRSQYSELFGAFSMGQLGFANAGSGSPFSDFLLGYPQQAQRQVGSNKSYLRSNSMAVFIQDDFRILPSVTLNLGVRYDLNPPPVEKFDRWANFLPELGRSIRPGEPGYPRSLLRSDTNDVSPRLGIAWRLDRAGRSVLRAGYGVFYGMDAQFQTYQALGATAFPFTRLELLVSTPAARLRLASPFAGAAGTNPAALSPNGVAYENRSPFTQNWNLTFAHELTPDLGVEAAYVGSRGSNLSAAINVNQTIRAATGNRSPFPGLSRVIVFTPSGSSQYNALQASIRRRMASGLAFRSSFTWSRAIDDVSFGSAARQPQDARNLRAERGLADFHRTTAWSSDLVYDLPAGRGRRFGSNWNAFWNALLGGWQVAAIAHLYSGRPFSATQTGVVQAGEPTRPDRLRDGHLDSPSVSRWFDVGAFRPVRANEFRFGNSGRNILIGPGRVLVDASLGKEFALPGDRARLQFRSEFFNLPNRANFGDPATAVDQPTAGVISSADPGRQIQFGLKVLF